MTDLLGWPSLVAVTLFAACCLAELVWSRPASPSAHGFGRMATNFSMPAVAAILAAIAPFSATGAAAWAKAAGFGLFHWIASPAWLVVASAVLARSLANYWLHRAFHSWPWLWRIHRVHHSDRSFDVTLAVRHHPLESLAAIAVNAATAALLGLPLAVALAIDLVMLAAGYWEHLDIDLPRGWSRVLQPWFTSPGWHRVHHSALQRETDSNFGSLIALWDRLFGTDRPVSLGPVDRIGLGDEEDRIADDWRAQLLRPFRR